MDFHQRITLVKRNLAEAVTEEELEKLLREKEHPSVYLGLAPTGKIHIGYFVPFMKLKDFIKAGFKVTLLLADLHAHLDDRKAPFELLDKRVAYYKEASLGILESLGADAKQVSFVRGTDFQLEKEYVRDMLKLSAMNTLARCKRAASEVVRFGDEPKLSGFIYPIMQALDEEYLKVDCQYGGIDQRKILMFARENLPKLGYKPRIEIMTPMLPGLTGDKMSSSIEQSKVDILASKEEIKARIGKAYCPEGEVMNNSVLGFFRYVIMVLNQDNNKPLLIKRPEKFGGNLSMKSYEELENTFREKKLHPMDLKNALIEELDRLIGPIRKRFRGKERILAEAYPAA